MLSRGGSLDDSGAAAAKNRTKSFRPLEIEPAARTIAITTVITTKMATTPSSCWHYLGFDIVSIDYD